MSKALNLLLSILTILLLLGSCGRKENEARYTVDLAAAVRGGAVERFDLTEAFRFEHRLVIDEETQPFRAYSFSAMDEQTVLLNDDYTVARVSLEDGSILATYGRVGRGPMEYTRVRSVSYMNDSVYVRSNTKVVVCEPDGNAVQEYRMDVSSDNLVFLPDGNRFRFYAIDFEDDVPLYDVLDAAGNVLRTSDVICESIGETAIMYLNGALKYDGAWYSLPRLTDIIWQISETGDIPWIELKQGSYKMPPEYLVEPGGRSAVSDLFIWVYNWALVGKYFFCTFSKAGIHHVVYDLESGKLLHHSMSPRLSEGGIPFVHEGETVDLWPVFIDGHHIIFRGRTLDELWLFSRK